MSSLTPGIETAFLMQDRLRRCPDDLRIDVGPRAIDRIEVDHHDPQGDADVRRGDPDTGRGVHGLDQVAGEVAQRAVKHRHRLRREGQPRIGKADDGANGHAEIAATLQDGSA
jgi:hypothetical protein